MELLLDEYRPQFLLPRATNGMNSTRTVTTKMASRRRTPFLCPTDHISFKTKYIYREPLYFPRASQIRHYWMGDIALSVYFYTSLLPPLYLSLSPSTGNVLFSVKLSDKNASGLPIDSWCSFFYLFLLFFATDIRESKMMF